MKTARRFQRSRVARPARRTLWPLCLAACAVSIPTARAASCVDMRGGDLLVSASQSCIAQMRQSPQVRRQVTQQIGSGVAQSASTASVAAAAPSSRLPERARTHGLDHPLARLSMLNSQSRYLWSLSQPAAPTYYGQAQNPTR